MDTSGNNNLDNSTDLNSRSQSLHPNGQEIKFGMKRPLRDDKLIFEDVFPQSEIGRTLYGLVSSFLIKQEHRIGWARKSACGESILNPFPNETVASHQWGVAYLVMIVSRVEIFKKELPTFDRCKAIEMALSHDLAELVTGDITPVDGISPEEKHRLEKDAMGKILSCFPACVGSHLDQIYTIYEDRECQESKFVKDCDKLDFMIHAYLLEREGFTGFPEFYVNSTKTGFFTETAQKLADLLVQVRNDLADKNLLYQK